MKIGAGLPPAVRPMEAAGSAAPDRSFAQLLEDGTRAATIIGERALGFGEAGLMGLRFAQGSPPEAEAAIGSTGRVASPAEDAVRESFRLPSAPAPAEETRRAQVGLPSAETGGRAASVQRTPGRTAAPPASPRADLIRTAQVTTSPSKAEDAAGIGRALLARLAERLTAAPGARARVEVSLRSEEQGIAILLTGFAPGEDEWLEYEAISRAVAAEFGVQIVRLAAVQANGTRGGG